MKLTSEQKRNYELIDEILWKDWDPIGINDIEDIRDEYQNYTPQIFNLVIKRADKIEIADQLYRFETIDMGLTGNKIHCEEVAQKIIDTHANFGL